MFLANQRFVFCLSPLTESCPQPSAIPGGNPPADWQSSVGWGDTRIEPGIAGQQSGAIPLNQHASLPSYFWSRSASNVLTKYELASCPTNCQVRDGVLTKFLLWWKVATYSLYLSVIPNCIFYILCCQSYQTQTTDRIRTKIALTNSPYFLKNTPTKRFRS